MAEDEPAISLRTYADICAEALGVPDADRAVIAERHGVATETWERGLEEWSDRLENDDDAPEAREFRMFVKTALERSVGPHTPVPVDRYVEMMARLDAGHAVDVVLAEHQLDGRTFWLVSYEWMVRGDEDRRLAMYIKLRTRKRHAELTNEATRSAFVVLGPGNLVRARRCSNCGALKASKPLTAYVYCDYCATCFDYDDSVEFHDRTALDSDWVDGWLGTAIKDELVAAFRAGDREAYARTYAWQVEMSIDLCPIAYSPRIKDPAYKRRLVDDVLVPWVVITVFDKPMHDVSEKRRGVEEKATRSRKLEDILELHVILREALEREADLFERHGLFERHPDRLDRTMYLHINTSIFVRPWLAVLSDADQKRLLDATGVACEYVPAPVVAFSPCSCGVCGRKLQVPERAQRMVCEVCGVVLELERRFPCHACGASISLPANGHDVVCGSCNVRWIR